MTLRHRHSSGHLPAFTLTEVIVALGVFVFAITALMGVIPFGMNQVRTASNESRAMAEMESIRDDVSLAVNAGMEKSSRYGISPPAAGAVAPVDYRISENGEVLSGNGKALFRITGTIRRPGASQSEPGYLHLRATWPAAAPAGKEDGAVELVAAFKS